MITFWGWMAIVSWFDTRLACWSTEFLLSCDVSEQTVAHTRVLVRKHKIGVSYILSLGVIPRWFGNFMFRNVGKSNPDTGESTKRTNTIFTTRRKFYIKKNMGKMERLWH